MQCILRAGMSPVPVPICPCNHVWLHQETEIPHDNRFLAFVDPAMLQPGENGALPSLAEALKGRTSIKSIVEAEDEGLSNVGSSLLVAGWVRTGRQQGSGAYEPWAFLELNDGSTHANLQV